jgi:PAS domain S-box-containing protein
MADFLILISGLRVFEFGLQRFNSMPEQPWTNDPELLDRITDRVIALNTDWCFTYLNDAGEELFDKPADILLGQCIWDTYPWITDSETYSEYHEAMNQQEPKVVELCYEPWGTWCEEHLYPSSDGLLIISREITEQRKRQHELRETRERLHLGLEVTDSVIWEWDPATDEITVDPSFDVLFDEEVQNLDDFLAQIYPDDRDEVEQAIEAAVDGEESYSVEYRVSKGEDFRWFSSIGEVKFDDEGNPKHFRGVTRDITDKKKQENRLRRYRRAVEASNDMLAAIDSDLNLLFANREYRFYHGIKHEDIRSGTSLPEVLDSEAFESIKPIADRVISGETVNHQIERVRESRPDRTFDARFDPLTDPETDEIEGAVGIFRDVTDIVDRNRQLQVLERVFRHNIRNAMTVIIGNAALIAESAPSRFVGPAEDIRERGNNLMSLVEKERKIVNFLTEPSNVKTLELAGLVRRAVNGVRNEVQSAEIRLDTPEEVRVVALPKVEQAIRELVRNGVHHSGQESEVDIVIEDYEDEVVIKIADNGPGLPSNEREILTGEIVITPVKHGTGLGLWLAQLIVSKSEGTISVDVGEDEGTVVEVTLPAA